MKEKKSYSIKEIAEIAGVSPSTVSRVINDTAFVDENKKARVMEVIKETKYVPNKVARSLFKRSSNIIGYIVPSSANPFFTEIGRYIEQIAFERGYNVIFCNSNNDIAKENDYIRTLMSMNTDAIVLITNNTTVRQEMNLPVVIIDREFDYENDFLYVSSNHYMGGSLAVEHLYNKGCRNIAFIGGTDALSSARLRHKAYVEFCSKMGLHDITINSEFDFEDGIKKAKYLLDNHENIDGIIACNDVVAMAIYKILYSRGIRVPKDVKLIGYDDIRESKRITPALTTIAQPIRSIAEITANNIIDVIEGKTVEIKKVILPVELIERETT